MNNIKIAITLLIMILTFGTCSIETPPVKVCIDPVFSPKCGSYVSSVNVSITTATEGAYILYTFDENNSIRPNKTNGIIYSGSITITKSGWLCAIVYKSGYVDSNPLCCYYEIIPDGTVGTPIISPPSATICSTQSVCITCNTIDAVIIYTDDGTLPDYDTANSTIINGKKYTGCFNVSKDTTIRAIVYKLGIDPSREATATYTFKSACDIVATPIINPGPGNYSCGQIITITCSTSDASIRYTVDGSTPNFSSGIQYNGPFSLTCTSTLIARAFKSGWADSDPTPKGDYIIQIPTPIITPASGTYTNTQTISISCACSGVSIYYTLNGNEPNETSGILYSSPFTLSCSANVRVKAYKECNGTSLEANNNYVFRAEAPVISPPPGTYTTPRTISISSATSGASIRYTLDGSDPSPTSGTVYTAPFILSCSSTVKAIAYKNCWEPSPIAEAHYIFQVQIATPVFSPAQGTYTGGQCINITCSTAGVIIRYTLDGSDPSPTNGAFYNEPVCLDCSSTLKAIAYNQCGVFSSIRSGDYILQVATPVISSGSGSYTGEQLVTITSATSDATIRFTLDTSDPSPTNGTIYTAPITVGCTGTIKAVAYKDCAVPSSIASATYTIKVPTPILNPSAAESPCGEQCITISCAMSDATIRYTINGSNPTTTSGTIYTAPICIAYTATVRAIAYKDNCATPSLISTSNYTINIPTACFTVSPNAGSTITTFTFDASCSTSPDASTLQYRWDFNNDGIWDRDFSTNKTTTHQYTQPGTYTAKLEIINGSGCYQSITKPVMVGIFEGFENGIPFDWETGGDYPWVLDSRFYCSGSYAASDGALSGTGQQSWLRISVSGPLIVKFKLIGNISSYLHPITFSVDNVILLSLNETQRPSCIQQYSFQVASGDHTLEWLCTYGGSFPRCLDDVEFIQIVE